MRAPRTPVLAVLLAATAALAQPAAPSPATPAGGDAAASAAAARAAWYRRIVDLDFVARHAVLPRPGGTLIVDARPLARKYERGHIPTAISLPDAQFEQLAAQRLPADKATPLIFYCDGYECLLSHNSARKAEALGYTNVQVYAAGYPDWIASGRPAEGRPQAPVLKAGREEGSVTVASFEAVYREAPDSVHLVDVREPHEVAAGSLKGARNIPVGGLDKRLEELPADKPIVFFCGAGSRSGEAYDLARLHRPELRAHFLNARIRWTPDGGYTIVENP